MCEGKVSYVELNKFHRNLFQGFDWQFVIIGSDNGLVPIWQQAIIWTNDDPVHWWKYVSPGQKLAEYCGAHYEP